MPRHAIIATLIFFSLSTGCAILARDDDAPPATPGEIIFNPRVAFDEAMPIGQLRLRGIALGDDEAMIPPGKIKTKNDMGWVETRQMCKYRIIDGKVVTLGCWDYGVLDQLGVREEADVERVLGKPDRRYELSTNIVSFHYRDGQVRTLWHRFENRLVALNVGRAMSDLDGEGNAPP